jgi:hypothetical protein
LIGSAWAVLTLLDDNHARSPTETAGEAHRYSDISLILAGTDAGMDAGATARPARNPLSILELWLAQTYLERT